jgi:hypothetical protein
MERPQRNIFKRVIDFFKREKPKPEPIKVVNYIPPPKSPDVRLLGLSVYHEGNLKRRSKIRKRKRRLFNQARRIFHNAN